MSIILIFRIYRIIRSSMYKWKMRMALFPYCRKRQLSTRGTMTTGNSLIYLIAPFHTKVTTAVTPLQGSRLLQFKFFVLKCFGVFGVSHASMNAFEAFGGKGATCDETNSL